MRGIVSKRIRRIVYGKDYATNSESRRYKLTNLWRKIIKGGKKEGNRIDADKLRQAYQATKKAYTIGKLNI